MPVSVPEKTLEHWVSQYLTYRYRSKVALWWPAYGVDVDVRSLPNLPGKAVQLELKTTTTTRTNPSQHSIDIDLGQLKSYLTSQAPVFYVIPRPTWQGELEAAARSAGLPAAEIAFSRSGQRWWFAEWMIVLTAKQVKEVLFPGGSVPAGATRGNRKRLVDFTIGASGSVSVSWANGVMPVTYEWRDFWTRLGQCGESDWPQIVRVPRSCVRGRSLMSRQEVFSALTGAAGSMDEEGQFVDEVIDFAAVGNDVFRIIEPSDSAPVLSADSEDDEYRQVVFLNARALG